MKYDRFEDLPVWQLAADLASRMFVWTNQPVFRGKGDLANQIQRASLSISNNIAEGFERGTTAELLTFLYIARGSAGEVRSMMQVMLRSPPFQELQTDLVELDAICESLSRQLRSWAASLQEGDIRGQRYLNDSTRADHERKKQSEKRQAERRAWMVEQEARLREKARQRSQHQLDQQPPPQGNPEI